METSNMMDEQMGTGILYVLSISVGRWLKMYAFVQRFVQQCKMKLYTISQNKSIPNYIYTEENELKI